MISSIKWIKNYLLCKWIFFSQYIENADCSLEGRKIEKRAIKDVFDMGGESKNLFILNEQNFECESKVSL